MKTLIDIIKDSQLADVLKTNTDFDWSTVYDDEDTDTLKTEFRRLVFHRDEYLRTNGKPNKLNGQCISSPSEFHLINDRITSIGKQLYKRMSNGKNILVDRDASFV